jgi:hypothetical protein
MQDIPGLQQVRERRFFEGWDGYVAAEKVTASEDSIRSLIDALVALGPKGSKRTVRREVRHCVERFNELDEGWICTIEREDIVECLGQIVDLCGMDGSAEWVDEGRNW